MSHFFPFFEPFPDRFLKKKKPYHTLYNLKQKENFSLKVWLCLYNLLSCREIMEKYQLNDFRLSVLARVQARLQDSVVEQLPVLSHLKTWLAQVSISRPPPAKPSLILELVPERVNQNLSLEQWSLESCAALVRDVTGLRLKIRVQD